MAASYVVTIGTTDFGFDWVANQIEVENLVQAATAEEIKLACRDAEASVQGIVFDVIAETFNPVQLTATTSTFLTVILQDPWLMHSLGTAGALVVGEGNVVGSVDGVAIFSPDNTLVTYVNNTSAAGVLVQNADIDIIRKLIQNRQYTNPVSSKMEVQNDGNTAIEFQADIWEDDGTTAWDGTGPIVRRDKLDAV